MSNALNAAWLQRFAARVIQMAPATMPLDAVRYATTTFPDAADLEPEEAAEFFAAGEPRGRVGVLPMPVGPRHAAAPPLR